MFKSWVSLVDVSYGLLAVNAVSLFCLNNEWIMKSHHPGKRTPTHDVTAILRTGSHKPKCKWLNRRKREKNQNEVHMQPNSLVHCGEIWWPNPDDYSSQGPFIQIKGFSEPHIFETTLKKNKKQVCTKKILFTWLPWIHWKRAVPLTGLLQCAMWVFPLKAGTCRL